MKTAILLWLNSFLPSRNTVDHTEKMRACAGAVVGLFITGLLCHAVLGHSDAIIYLIAPMGASTVLLFCVPASPLAQPWSVVGGNVVSALIGVACTKLFGTMFDSLIIAATLACALAIGAMFLLRCLHPPSGAVALTAVLGGPAVHALGFEFALMPVALNSVILVATAILYNNATGRRYPHAQQIIHPNVHDTKDIAPTQRLGFTPEDLEEVLQQYNQVLDVSRDDLEEILLRTEMHAYQRRFGLIRCADIMSKDVISVAATAKLEQAWQLMCEHHLTALPVVNQYGNVAGIVTLQDFLQHSGVNTQKSEYGSIAEKLGRFVRPVKEVAINLSAVVGDIMTAQVSTIKAATPITDLVPIMADSGLHHFPVIDDAGRFVGIITHSDLIAGLYENRLAQQG